MGKGISIRLITEPTAPPWPTKVVTVVCVNCGATLEITKYQERAELPSETRKIYDILGVARPGEPEQYCPLCGVAACEEAENKPYPFFGR